MKGHGRGYDNMEDNKIVELYWQRAENAISETKEKYNNYCFRVAISILNNTEDADECVNDTYLRAWNSIPPHRPERLSTFLGKITRNLALNKYRDYNAEKRGKGQTAIVIDELAEVIPDNKTTEGEAESRYTAEQINSFLKTLPVDTRRIFIRRYWHLMSIGEIAIRDGVSKSKIKSLLFRTRKQMKKYLEKRDAL